jgi:protein SCO1/2
MMNMKSKFPLLFILLFFISFSCKNDSGKLPYLGHKTVVDGKEIAPTIRPFSYKNQDGDSITNASLKNHIYITDFFFTSCPSICPQVMRQMLRIHDEFKEEEMVKLVSFTIDPKRDSVAKLADYANKLGVKSDKWLFLTGDKDFTLDLADDFYIAALEDPTVPGGFDHSGKIVLVDKMGHVRAFCEGTDPETIPKFIEDVKTLVREYR